VIPVPVKPKNLTPSETDDETTWLSGHDARQLLGGVSRQRLAQLKAEHSIPTKTDNGIMRYDESAVLEARDRMGIGSDEDPSAVALQTLRENNAMLSDHIRQIHASVKLTLDTLLAENADIRKMRAEESKAHLAALVATQEALDLSAERKHMLESSQAREARMHMATHWMITTLGPEILKQWRSGQQSEKITRVIRALEPEQFEALKVFVPKEDLPALEELRNERRGNHDPEPAAPDHGAG